MIVLPDRVVEPERDMEVELVALEDADADVTVEDPVDPNSGDAVTANTGAESRRVGEDPVLAGGHVFSKDKARAGDETSGAVPMEAEGQFFDEEALKPTGDEHLDPTRGWPRPTGLCKGCWLYQWKKGLARAWTLPPHMRGGTIAVRLIVLDVGTQFGEVVEVYHSALFTTAKVRTTTALRVLMQGQG